MNVIRGGIEQPDWSAQVETEFLARSPLDLLLLPLSGRVVSRRDDFPGPIALLASVGQTDVGRTPNASVSSFPLKRCLKRQER